MNKNLKKKKQSRKKAESEFLDENISNNLLTEWSLLSKRNAVIYIGFRAVWGLLEFLKFLVILFLIVWILSRIQIFNL